MDLRERLERAGVMRKVPVSDAEVRSPATGSPPLESLVDGEWVTAREGRCFVAERVYPLDHAHGLLRLGDLLDLDPAIWSPYLHGTDFGPVDPRKALFIDTETTGLMRGAGTYVFLVGIGYFVEGGFVLRQYFMPDYGDEEVLLNLLTKDLYHRPSLISFNGRSFDWPLLRTRYVLVQGSPPTDDPPHLDLLLLSRRLWRRRLASCSLGSLEANILDLTRSSDDVPGYLIPQIYSDYVRSGMVEPIAQVFYHNAIDILSLVTLAARIGRLLTSPAERLDEHHGDPVALGRLYERTGRVDEAIRLYRVAVSCGGDEDKAEAGRYLSFLLKRLGRREEAMEIWRDQLGNGRIYPYVEMAKHLEHREGDFAKARRLVIESIESVRVQSADASDPSIEQALAELKHRLARLDRRIAAREGGVGDA